MAKKSTQDLQNPGQEETGVAPSSGEQTPLETAVDQGAAVGAPEVAAQPGEQQPPVAAEPPVVNTVVPPGAPDPEPPVAAEPPVVNAVVPPGTPDPEPPVMVECAVLLDCIYGKHDDIITLTESEAKAAQAGGYVDTHPNAIKAIRGH